MPPLPRRGPKETREPSRLELADGDGALDATGLVPDTETHLRIVVEVPRDPERLARIAWVRREELDELAPERRRAPRAVTEPPLDVSPALRAGLHGPIFP